MDGSGTIALLWEPQPEISFYAAVEDTNPVPDYHVPTPASPLLSFTGTEFTASGRVVETNESVPISLDELYSNKIDELVSYSNLVYFSAFEHVVGQLAFWVKSDQISLHSRHAYNSYLATRIADTVTAAIAAGVADGGGTNGEVAAFWNSLKAAETGPVDDQYWSRDIKVFLFDQTTLKEVRDTANQNQWSGLMRSQATFGWQVRNANARVSDDIVAAYGDGTGAPGGTEWQALAAIDVAAASYNWPPFYAGDLGPQNGSITIQQIINR
jgi:hypothetical protein